MSKSIIGLVLSIAVLAILLTGCSDEADPNPSNGTDSAREFASVSAGWFHTCGVRTDGSVECWGWNVVGQATSPSGEFASVSAGNQHTCGVRTDGSVECWGVQWI